MAVDTQLTVSGLVAFTAPKAVLLTWDKGEDGCLPYLERDVYEVWRASTNDRTQATRIAQVEANTYTDHDFNNSQSWYYWVRVRNVDGEEGPWHPTSATGGVEAAPVNYATSDSLGGNASDVDVGAGKAVAETGADRTLNQGPSLLVYSATAPSHVEGRVWIDSGTGDISQSISGAWVQIGSNDALRLSNAPAEAGADATSGKDINTLSNVGTLATLNQVDTPNVANNAISSTSTATGNNTTSVTAAIDDRDAHAVLVLGFYMAQFDNVPAGGNRSFTPSVNFPGGSTAFATAGLFNDGSTARTLAEYGNVSSVHASSNQSAALYGVSGSFVGGDFNTCRVVVLALKK